MATHRLPTPGGDDGQWGDILNDYLGVAHNTDGTLAADSVSSVQVTAGSLPVTKLDNSTQTKIAGSAQVANNLSDLASIPTARTNLGLGNVDNTSDVNKPVSTAQAAALALKAPLSTAPLVRLNPVGLTSPVVGTRPPSAYTGSGSGNVGYNGRIKDVLAADCSDLRLVFTSPLAIDNDGTGNTVVTEVGVETTIGGTIIPVTFRGRTSGSFDANGLIVSDPIPGYYTKGTAIWYRTFSYTETAVCGTWTTVSSSNVATISSYGFGKGKLTIGAIIFGAGITGFTNTITDISTTQLTVTLTTAASSSATGTFYSNAGQGQVTHSGYIDASEYGGAPTGTSPNLSKSGTITSITANSTGPTVVLADRVYGTRPPCVLLMGDSLTAGTGWAATDFASRKGTSFATIGVSAGGAAGSSTATYDTPYINMGKGGETAAQFATVGTSFRRRKLWGFGTHAIVEYGINDVGAGTSLAAIQASLTSIWNDLIKEGIQVWACTIPPKTNSTDGWTTTVNQTKAYTAPQEAIRTGVNDWIRTTPAPLSGYFDTADQWETSRNSGIWIPNTVYTSDGLGIHPNNQGHINGATAIDRTRFTS